MNKSRRAGSPSTDRCSAHHSWPSTATQTPPALELLQGRESLLLSCTHHFWSKISTTWFCFLSLDWWWQWVSRDVVMRFVRGPGTEVWKHGWCEKVFKSDAKCRPPPYLGSFVSNTNTGTDASQHPAGINKDHADRNSSSRDVCVLAQVWLRLITWAYRLKLSSGSTDRNKINKINNR